jgi:hypothetical protein
MRQVRSQLSGLRNDGKFPTQSGRSDFQHWRQLHADFGHWSWTIFPLTDLTLNNCFITLALMLKSKYIGLTDGKRIVAYAEY